jgi:hypothetical protein
VVCLAKNIIINEKEEENSFSSSFAPSFVFAALDIFSPYFLNSSKSEQKRKS